MARRITAVIFDRDGVLADFDRPAAVAYFQPLLPISVAELSEQWQQWGQKVGFPRSLAEESNFWRRFWEDLGERLKLPVETRVQLHQLDYTRFMRPFPDARPALEITSQRGLQVGVLSNFSLASLEPSLQALGLADLVDVACAAPVIGVAKPAPAAYLTVTQALQAAPENCLFFDDEMICVEGARRVGMYAYLVDRSRATHDLSRQVVSDLSILPELLG